ncbi:MAG: hypothetical protein U0230_05030 [Polyangiales bacterium]
MRFTPENLFTRTTYEEARAELIAHLEACDGTIAPATLQSIGLRCEEEEGHTIPVGSVFLRLADEGRTWRSARGLDPDGLFVGEPLE